MNLHTEKAGFGRYAAPCVNVYSGEVLVGQGHFNPVDDSWRFEQIRLETDDEALTRAQRLPRDAAGNIAQRDFDRVIEDSRKARVRAALTPDELTEARRYVASLPIPDLSSWIEQEESPVLNLRPALEIPLPLPDVRFIPVELGELDKLKTQIRDLTAQNESLDKRLAALEGQGARLSALEAQFRVHISACPTSIARTSAFGGGFRDVKV